MSNPLKVPTTLPKDGILLGYSLEHEQRQTPIGFHSPSSAEPSPKDGYLTPLLYDGGNHLMSIAPTGAGKGVSCVIPTLLRYQGPIIVVDPKGENYAVTARQRKKMGHKVIKLSPFEKQTDGLNPLDMFSNKFDSVDDALELAKLIVRPNKSDRNPFWDEAAGILIAALLIYIKYESPKPLQNLSELVYQINQSPDDMELTIKDMRRLKNKEIDKLLGIFSKEQDPRVFNSILVTAIAHTQYLASSSIQKSIKKSSFNLDEITKGDPLSIYIVIPPEKLESHGAIIKLWVGVLMSAITKRRSKVENKTLFILDEAAQLGTFPHLRRAITLLRGYGLQTWSFWQDFSQLKSLYPLDWETMFNNSQVFQYFGTSNYRLASSIASLVGEQSADEILDLDADEMILLMAGDQSVIAQKPNYLTDPAFDGLFDANPYYVEKDQSLIKPQRRQRQFKRKTLSLSKR